MTPLSIPVIVMAGITFYVGAHHLFIFSKRTDCRVNLTFALLCFAMSLYDVFCVGVYNVASVAEGIHWQRAQLATLALVGAFFMWFIADYTRQTRKRWLYMFTAFFLIGALVEMVDRSNLTWLAAEPFIKEIQLPFGLEITYHEMAPGLFTNILSGGGVILFVYIFIISIQLYRGGQQKKAKPLMLAMVILFIGLLNDFAVVSGMYKFIYIIEYVYMALVLLMAGSLATEVVEAAKMKEALQESEDRFRMLTESTSDWIWEVDENAVYRYASPKIKDLLGYDASEVLGKTPFDFMPPDEAKRVAAMFGPIVASRRPFAVLENRNLHKDGRTVVIETSGVPIFDAKGVFLGYRGIDREVTERKKIEEEIKRLNAELEQRVRERTQELENAYEELKTLDEAKDAFLSSVSHELRTPLTAIRSFSEILFNYDGVDSASQKEFLRIINTESERLTRLINDVLDLSKIEAGRGFWNDAPLSLEKAIKMVVQVQRPLLDERRLHVRMDIPRDLPHVFADQDRIQQVIMNLLGNAVKFSSEGGEIRIRAEIFEGRRSGESQEWVKVSISDQGIGIEEKNFKTIFDKFGQVVTDTLHDKPKGAGLGLPICKEIITHYGGNIWVESEKGKGSSFHFTLPRAVPSERPINDTVLSEKVTP